MIERIYLPFLFSKFVSLKFKKLILNPVPKLHATVVVDYYAGLGIHSFALNRSLKKWNLKKEQPWANRSCPFLKKSNREQIAP